MNAGDTLYAISEAGLTLAASKTEDNLRVYPAENITPGLAKAIKEHKADIIRIMREDEEMRRTGVIQSQRQVSELTRERLGPSRPFDPREHPPSVKEMWTNQGKEAFFFPDRNGGPA